MNIALLTKFTPDVLRGAASLGFEYDGLMALLGITRAGFSGLNFRIEIAG